MRSYQSRTRFVSAAWVRATVGTCVCDDTSRHIGNARATGNGMARVAGCSQSCAGGTNVGVVADDGAIAAGVRVAGELAARYSLAS